ncbi:P1 family peptidase [Gallicola sp. Sow4_E12]|uniref:P1 family peptidase n=1 Tax=Gallicola sp. Sow4_E12 TaxID=3438785 RepID=UPI003F90419B
MHTGSITDIGNILVGHAENDIKTSGTTTLLFPEGAACGVDVRGSAPGTRETDLLRSENLVQKVHGISFSGGSAFGLDCATGVMKYLREQSIGFDMGMCKIPIVTAAVIFDLAVLDFDHLPDARLGYESAAAAKTIDTSQGNIGAGTGATVGKYLGFDSAMKAGLGQASMKIGDLWIGAVVVTNSFGDIYDEKNNQIAGVYDRSSMKLIPTLKLLEKSPPSSAPSNTTIGVIGTNGSFSKTELNKIAQMAHDGYARSIRPVHTMNDGDTIFAVSTGTVKADLNQTGSLASIVMMRAIENSIYAAEPLMGIPAWKGINEKNEK